MAQQPAILGTGAAFPAKVRLNDDPVFTWIIDQTPPDQRGQMFTGLKERRVLAEDEEITTFMVDAAKAALVEAQVDIADIDLIVGYSSVSTWLVPNDLMLVAKELGAGPNTKIIPVANFYANFSGGLELADAMIAAGRSKNALIVVGCNWTRHVSYKTPQCLAAGDAAGAAVVGPATSKDQFRLVESRHVNALEYFGGMYMTDRATASGVDFWANPIYEILDLGRTGFFEVATAEPVNVIKALIVANSVGPTDYNLIAYQASDKLFDPWSEGLQLEDGQLFETLAEYADMVLANVAANLALGSDSLTKDHLVLLDLGPEISVSALLYSRG